VRCHLLQLEELWAWAGMNGRAPVHRVLRVGMVMTMSDHREGTVEIGDLQVCLIGTMMIVVELARCLETLVVQVDGRHGNKILARPVDLILPMDIHFHLDPPISQRGRMARPEGLRQEEVTSIRISLLTPLLIQMTVHINLVRMTPVGVVIIEIQMHRCHFETESDIGKAMYRIANAEGTATSGAREVEVRIVTEARGKVMRGVSACKIGRGIFTEGERWRGIREWERE